MGTLRNKEIRKMFIWLLLLSVLFSIGGWIFISSTCGIYVSGLSLTMIVILFVYTKRRYDILAEFSNEIDQILHGNHTLNLGEYAEGELSILHSEIEKMVIQLKEQAAALQNDKIYLTDAIADISHQLRTPLTSINIIVEFLRQDRIEDARRMALAKDLQKLLNSIDWLIAALLKMAKIDAGTATFREEPIVVEELIRKASEPFAIQMELKNQTLHISMSGKERFTGDLLWTCEAVSNLIKNCMEHTPKDGNIYVFCSENAIFTEIIVADDGPGFRQADLPHLFERFYKGEFAGEHSVGIGLALARMIITQQNGVIKAENQKQGGAKFVIRFYKSVV